MTDAYQETVQLWIYGVSSKSSGVVKDKLEKEYEMLQKVENVHMDVWKSVTMCKASFINTVKNYTAVKTYIPGLRIRMFLYHRIKLSRLSLIIHSSWYNQKRMKAWMLMETLKTLTGKYFCTWVVYTYWEMLNVLLGQIVYFVDGNYDNMHWQSQLSSL